MSLSFISLKGAVLSTGEILNDTIRLDEVAVTVLPFGQAYQESAGGVFLLVPDQVDLQYQVNTAELFNLVPGVQMSSGTYNTSRLVIRGVGSRTPYNTNRIRAYLDDIPLTSGDGVSTLEDQDYRAIGRMEILKGPASSLYGSGLGGVVRLSSPYPQKDGFSASLSGEGGSFATGLYGINLAFKNENLAITGGLTNSASKGYRDNSKYGRTNAFMHMKLFGNRNTLSLTLSMVDLYARIPSSLNEDDYLNEPWKAGGSWGSIKGYEQYLRLLGGAGLETKLGQRVTNKLVLFSTYSDPYESRPFNILDDRATNLGFREVLRMDYESWKISTGMEYFHEWVDWKVYETIEGVRGKLISDQSETLKHMNAFAMVQWRPTDQVLVDGGINLNLISFALQTEYQSDSTDQSGRYSYQPVISPRIGISYLYHTHHHLYVSAGHGFSAPSLEETLLPEGAVNTELRPETGWNFELGERGRFLNGRIRYDATLYAVFLDDLLVTERITEDIFTGANAGKALNTGFELWGEFSILESEKTKPANPAMLQSGQSSPYDLKATVSYTLSNNRFTDFVDDGITYTGNKLPGIPSQLLNTILSARWKPLELKLHYQYAGGQWMDDHNSQKYDGQQLMHIQAGWRIRISNGDFRVRIHGGVRNLFNTRYASMILVNAPSFGGRAPRYYYPGLPRQFHLGATLHFR